MHTCGTILREVGVETAANFLVFFALPIVCQDLHRCEGCQNEQPVYVPPLDDTIKGVWYFDGLEFCNRAIHISTATIFLPTHADPANIFFTSPWPRAVARAPWRAPAFLLSTRVSLTTHEYTRVVTKYHVEEAEEAVSTNQCLQSYKHRFVGCYPSWYKGNIAREKKWAFREAEVNLLQGKKKRSSCGSVYLLNCDSQVDEFESVNIQFILRYFISGIIIFS